MAAILRIVRNSFWVAFFNLMAVVMAAAAIFIGWRSFDLTVNGGRTEGVVIELVGSDTYSPIFEYEVDGRTYSFESMNSSSPPAFDVGEEVEIFYDKDDPSRAEVNKFLDLWLVPLMLGPASLILGLVINIVYFYKLRRGEEFMT
jgi:hypothetical protein